MGEWSIAVGSGIVSVPPGINFATIKPSMCPVHFRCVPAMVTFFSARCARPWVTMKYAKNLCIITFTLSFRYVVGYLCCLRQCVVRLLLLGNVPVRWWVVRWLVRAAGELGFLVHNLWSTSVGLVARDDASSVSNFYYYAANRSLPPEAVFLIRLVQLYVRCVGSGE